MRLLSPSKKANTQGTAAQFSFSYPSLWSVFLVALVVLILVHIEIIIARQYAPETLLIRIGNTAAGTNCSADIATDDTAYEKPMRQIASIYQYLDSSVFTVTPDSGYFLLETGLQDYTEDYRVRVRCYTQDNTLLANRLYTNARGQRCLVQEKGRLLVC
jgi:hypothetical protein